MTEVLAKSQDGADTVSLDLKDPRVELNFEIQNNTKLSERSSPHSLSFKLPRTKKNNKFFNHYHEVNIAEGTWSAYSETTVEVFDEGIVVLVGILQLNNVNKDQYNVNVLGTTADFFRAIRGKSFDDLFAYLGVDLDHALTVGNVKDSWDVNNDITNGSVGNGTIVYPFVDHGYYPFGWYLSGSSGYFTGLNSNWNIKVAHLKPAIRVQFLMNAILKFAGYTAEYCAELTSTRFTELYMFLATEQNVVSTRPLYGAKVGFTSNVTLPAATPQALVTLLPSNESAPFFDPDNLFTTGVFIAPFEGTFVFSVQLVLSTAQTNDYYFSFNVSSTTQSFSDQVLIPAASNAGYVYTGTFQMTCTASQQVNFQAGAEGSSDIIINTSISGDNSFISVPLYDTENPTGAVVDMATNMPELTLDEWFKAMVDKFNIIIEPDIDSPTVLKVETAVEYFNGGVKKDWTKKLDVSQAKVIEPTTSLQKKRIIYSDAEGKDHKNEWWQRNWNWVKGQFIYENANDFAVEDEEIGDVFVPLRTQAIRKNSQTEESLVPNVLVSRQWINSENGAKKITNKPILAYYHRLQDIGNGYNFDIEGDTITQYPYFSAYSATPIAADTVSLNWGYDYPDDDTHPLVNGVPFFFMFRKYWASYIDNIYNADARLMNCSVFLSPQDVRDLRFNDKIWIDDSYWRVLSVNNYVVSGNTPCKVKLLKVIDQGDWDCTQRPDTYNSDGTVDFVSVTDGTAVIVNRECCERFGYKYDSVDRDCFYKSVSPTIGGNPTVPSFETAYTLNGGATPTPSPIVDSFNKSFSASDYTVNVMEFGMEKTTTGNKAVSMNLLSGGTDIEIAPNMIYAAEIDIVAMQTGGTSGTVGDVDTMKLTGTVKTFRGGGGEVGSFHTISHQSDHTNVHGVSWQIVVGANRPAVLNLRITGQANHIIRFFAHVRLTAMSVIKFI
jgi:hypothetical protein